MTTDKNRQTVIDFLKKIPPGNTFGNFIQVTKDGEPYTFTGMPCHASFIDKPNSILIGSGFNPTVDQASKLKKFWGWITDSNSSPWRKLTTLGIELVEDKGLPKGWIINEDVIKKVPFDFIKNFAILTRIAVEKYDVIERWDKYIQEFELHPADAFYLAAVQNANLTGGHFPLTDYDFYGTNNGLMDWEVYKTGNVNFDHECSGSVRINRWFLREKQVKQGIFSKCFVPISNKKYEAFTHWLGTKIQPGTPQDYVKNFKEWKRQYEIE